MSNISATYSPEGRTSTGRSTRRRSTATPSAAHIVVIYKLCIITTISNIITICYVILTISSFLYFVSLSLLSLLRCRSTAPPSAAHYVVICMLCIITLTINIIISSSIIIIYDCYYYMLYYHRY